MTGQGKKSVQVQTFSALRGGKRIKIESHVDNIPILSTLPVWSERPLYTKPINPMNLLNLYEIIDDRAYKMAAYHFGPGSQSIEIKYKSFARMLAKIAHCAIIAQYGIDSFRPFLSGIILGVQKDFHHFIGNVEYHPFELKDDPASEDVLAIRWRTGHNAYNDLFCWINFFSFLDNSPTYEIVAGSLTA